MNKYVVVSGLTRRLVTAKDARGARVKFLAAVPLHGNKLAVPYEAVRVYDATPEMLLEFQKGKSARFDDQLSLDLTALAPTPGPRSKASV